MGRARPNPLMVGLAALLLAFSPGLLTTAVAGGIGEHLLLTPIGSGHATAERLVVIGLFLLGAAIVGGLAHRVRCARSALRASEQKLRGFYDASHLGIVLTDVRGRYLEFNAAFQELCGYTEAQLRGLDERTLTPDEFEPERLRQREILKTTGHYGPYESAYVRQDGRRVPVQLHGMRFTAPDGSERVWMLVEDISARQRDRALQERLLREQRAIVESRLVGIVRVQDRRIAWCNAAFAEMFGYTPQELVGQSTRILYPSDAAHLQFRDSAFPIIDGGAIHRTEFQQRRKDGTLGWYDASVGRLSPDSNEQVGVFVDITALKTLTADLDQARADLQTILDNVPARITSWNTDLTNRFANREAERRFQLAPGRATGLPLRELIGEESYQLARHAVEAALAGVTRSYEQLTRMPDGSVQSSLITYVPQGPRGAVSGLFALAFDVTELRRSYERIRELAQRLETVREEERRAISQTLHEGIAQDLFATKLTLKYLQGQSRGRAGVQAACRELDDAVDRCLIATRQLANDLRPAALAHLQLAAAISEHAQHFAGLSGLSIRVIEREPLPPLDDATRLIFFRAAQEALTNVARHARAMCVDVVLGTEARSITMEISDDGVGIEDTALRKSGSLGLLGLRERFEALGGTLAVRRQDTGGTTVHVRIPRTGRSTPGDLPS